LEVKNGRYFCAQCHHPGLEIGEEMGVALIRGGLVALLWQKEKEIGVFAYFL
jgi:hypothetical protein